MKEEICFSGSKNLLKGGFLMLKVSNFLKLLLIILISIILIAAISCSMQKKTVRVIMANHPWKDALLPLIPDFEKKTGIKVNLENYEETQLTPKLTVEFTSGSSTIDVFMTRPLQEGKLFAKNKWYQPIDNYVGKTKGDYNWKDFPDVTVQAVTYDGKICAVPLVTEWEVLYYRTDLFAKANISIPTTLDELADAAKKLNNPKNGICGIVSRGQRNPSVTQFSGYLYGMGGDFIKDGKCVIDSPEAVNAIKFYRKFVGFIRASGSNKHELASGAGSVCKRQGCNVDRCSSPGRRSV